MPSPTISFNETRFRKGASKLLASIGVEEGPFIREEAALFAALLTKLTPPFSTFPQLKGGGYNTQRRHKEAGENAILRDMSYIFSVRSERYLNFLIRQSNGQSRNINLKLRQKDGTLYSVIVGEINTNSTQAALSFHKSKRNNIGRTSNNNSESEWDAAGKMWITQRIWNEVKRILQDRVGFSKAAMASVAMSLGRPRPGRWVARHLPNVISSHSQSRSPNAVTFRATGPGLDVAKRNSGRVERFRITAMDKKLKALVRREKRQAGFN